MTLLDWIIYAVVISAVFTLTAWSLDGLLRVWGRPSRWIWVAALTLSVGVPSGTWVLDSSSPAISRASAETPEALLESNPVRLAAAAIVFRTAGVVFEEAQVSLARGVVRSGDVLADLSQDEVSIERAWAAASLTLTLVLVIAFGRLWVDTRTWKRAVVQGHEVWISRAVGPASVGVVRPRVVLPEWAVDLGPHEVALVLAHEEEHARVRDPMLLSLAWIPVVVMPWNPLLWWQLRRLVSAVEVDCDRRVLRRGVNRRNYLALLIRLAARARGDRGLLPSVARFASPLKTRIDAMIGHGRFHHLTFPVALLVGLSFAAVACGPRVPEAIRESTAPPAYDPIRVFRNSQRFGPFVAIGAGGELVVRAGQPQDAARVSIPLIPLQPPQDTASMRPCEYWRINRDGTTSTGPGLVENARCVPRDSVGRSFGLGVGRVPGNPPPCVYWVPNPDSLVTRPGVIWNGQCGPSERPVFLIGP